MTSLKNIRGFIFDFDGTIARLTIDFADMRRRTLAHLESFGIVPDGLRDLYVLEMIAAGKRQIAEQYPGRENAYEQEAMQLIKEIELAAAHEGSLFGGIREMLLLLGKLNIKIGLVTRNCRAAVEHIFPDIASFIAVVLTRDDTFPVKPDPDHLRKALQAFSLPASQTAMVGDHKMDMILAKEVGALAIGVLTGYNDAEELKKAGADLVFPRAADLSAALSVYREENIRLTSGNGYAS